MRHKSSVSTSVSSTPQKTTRRLKRFTLGTVAVLALAGVAAGSVYTVQSTADDRESVAATSALSGTTGRQHDQLAAYSTIAEAHTDKTASVTLDEANQVLASTEGKADAAALTAVSSSLASFESMPIDLVVTLT